MIRQGEETSTDSVDVAIMGGGPAGATVGTLLAQMGHTVRLFERENGPRFHVGESLQPHTYTTFQRLGIFEKLKNSHFPPKHSVSFVSHDSKESKPFFFKHFDDHEGATTWHVWRSEFDQMMLDNAREKGCDVRENTRVTDVHFDENNRATGLTVLDANGQSQKINAKVVVDATGQSSLIANRLKLRVPNLKLRQASVWTYFKNAKLPKDDDGYTTVILNTKGKRGWFWYIPLAGDIMSVGVVSTFDYLMGRKLKPAELFAEQLEECPVLKGWLEGAEQTDDFHITRDFSYTSTTCAGEGWVLVGDAFGFLDPVYSTGILLALKSGEMAADAIDEGLKTNNLSGQLLGRWEGEHRRALELFRKLVHAFYSYEFSFGAFIREHPQYQRHLVDLLIGNVYREGVEEIFDAMGDREPYDGSPPTAESISAAT